MRLSAFCETDGRSDSRLLGIVCLLFLMIGLEGCIAYRTRQKEIVAPGGPGAFSAIKATLKASPTRETVQAGLGYLDTGVGSPSLFWGRWIRNSQLNVIAFGAPGAGGGSIGGAVGEHPVVENLVIEFDQNGRTVRWDVVDDDDLIKKMVPILTRTRNARVSQPSQIPPSCTFQWSQLARVKAEVPNRRVRQHDYKLLRLAFLTRRDTKIAACAVDVSPESAFSIFDFLISTGQSSILN